MAAYANHHLLNQSRAHAWSPFYSVAYNMLLTMKAFLDGLEVAPSLCWFFLGVLVGIASDLLWWRTGISKHEKKIEMFEHYHWGLTLLILTKSLLKFNEASLSFGGTGIAFIVAEITQEHPFALESNHQLSSTIIGVTLLILMVLV